MSTVVVRQAVPADVADILRLVHALAEYEHESDRVLATEADLQVALFPVAREPNAFAHVAELDGRVVGMAVWYLTFSTWTGRNGIWLEDLFVEPDVRGQGAGAALMSALAEVCVQRGYPRLEWWVLTWNEPSIAFYRRLGSVPQDEWAVHRIDGDGLARLASRSCSPRSGSE